MGKSKHARYHEKKEKEKTRFWWKWLGYVRGHWFWQGVHQGYSKKQMVVTKSLKIGDDLKVATSSASMDIIEIPIEPGKKVSKILIKPTKTGIKAMIAQYRRPSLYPERSIKNKLPVSGKFSCDIKGLDKDELKINEKRLKLDGKRLNWNTEVFKNETEIAQKDPLLTSALFISQDMDKIVESAVFIEPSLPKDYADLKKSDEISQKSIKINKRRVSYKIIDEKNNQTVKAFKSASEPTWKERKKILQQQRLQDNINDLLEQFLFLEAEDVIDFSIAQNKLTGAKKRIQFNKSSLGSKEPLIKELSREVSPEILVNIKPFKEYVSEDNVNGKKSSAGRMLKNCACETKQNDVMEKKFEEKVEKSKDMAESQKIREEHPRPILKYNLRFSEKNDSGYAEKSSYGITESILSVSKTEKEIKSTCYENYKEFSDLVSVEFNDDTLPKLPTCTVWGMYRTYSTCTGEEDEKKSKKNKEVEIKGQRLKPNRRSLDEVLDTLDDSNHDLIFKKNISQFRKKINVMPRCDFKKTATAGVAKMEQMKLKKLENIREIVKPGTRSATELTEALLENSRSKKMETFRFECLELWKHGRKTEKILENIYLLLSEAKLISRTLASRVEARTISFPQTFREVYDLLEKNNSTLMEIEIPRSFKENLRKMELFQGETSKAANSSPKFSIDMKKYGTIATLLSTHSHSEKIYSLTDNFQSPAASFSEVSKFFSSLTECFYVIQEHLFLDTEPKNNSIINVLTVSKTSSRKLLENAKSVEDEKIERDEKKQTEKQILPQSREYVLQICEPAYKISPRVVQILNDSPCDYVVRIYHEFSYPKISSKSWSEPDLTKKGVVTTKTHCSEFSITNLEKVMLLEQKLGSLETISKVEFRANRETNEKETASGVNLDGFQILYNNSRKSLNDDEEEATKAHSSRHLTERKLSQLFIADENQILDKEEEEEKKKKLEDSDEKSGTSEKKLEKKLSRMLKYKSNSSPRENIVQTEFSLQEHRTRRSLVLSKEIEKDFHSCKKKRLSIDKGVEIRRTGSELLESRTPTLRKDRSFVQKSSFGINETLRSSDLPDELKTVTESERRYEGKKKMIAMEKNEPSVRKEVVAAFNSIKEFSTTKGRNKRMSLVIMLSRK